FRERNSQRKVADPGLLIRQDYHSTRLRPKRGQLSRNLERSGGEPSTASTPDVTHVLISPFCTNQFRALLRCGSITTRAAGVGCSNRWAVTAREFPIAMRR